MSRAVDCQVKVFKQALEFDNEDPMSLLAPEPAHPAARFNPDILASMKFRAIMRLVVQKEAERPYVSRVNASVTKAV